MRGSFTFPIAVLNVLDIYFLLRYSGDTRVCFVVRSLLDGCVSHSSLFIFSQHRCMSVCLRLISIALKAEEADGCALRWIHVIVTYNSRVRSESVQLE